MPHVFSQRVVPRLYTEPYSPLYLQNRKVEGKLFRGQRDPPKGGEAGQVHWGKTQRAPFACLKTDLNGGEIYRYYHLKLILHKI